MGRNWQPKKDVVCRKCHWKGKRANPTAKECPKCHSWGTIIIGKVGR